MFWRYSQFKNPAIWLAKSILTPHLRNLNFPKYGISARIKQIIWNSFTDQTQKKIMTKFSNKSEKPYFWPIFPFLVQKIFFEKIWLSCTTTHRPLTSCWVSEKTKEPIPRKLPDRAKIGPFQLQPGSNNSKCAKLTIKN